MNRGCVTVLSQGNFCGTGTCYCELERREYNLKSLCSGWIPGKKCIGKSEEFGYDNTVVGDCGCEQLVKLLGTTRRQYGYIT